MRFCIGLFTGCTLAVLLVYIFNVHDPIVAFLIGLPCGIICTRIAENYE